MTVTLEPLTVLIGRNDSGKSSFLQAVAEMSAMPSRPSLRSNWNLRLESDKHAFLFDSEADLSAGPRIASDENLRPASWQDVRRAEIMTTAPLSLDPSRIAAMAPVGDASLDAFVAKRGGGTAAHLATLALGDRRRFDAIEAGLRDITKGRVQAIVVRDAGASMLADEHARIAAFGAEVAESSLPGTGAEEIPNPKHLWATYSGRSQHREGVPPDLHRDEQRRAAWQALRPEVVGRLCPRGFAPFDADARAALRMLLG